MTTAAATAETCLLPWGARRRSSFEFVTSHFAFLQGLLPPETRREEETLSVHALDVCHLIFYWAAGVGSTWESLRRSLWGEEWE